MMQGNSSAALVSLTAEERERYSRHILIPEVGLAGQEALRRARVLVVGAGGLGSPVLHYLAAAGVGTLGIVDFDRVDRSNLQRQVLHSDVRVGLNKADSAAAAVRALNPTVEVELVRAALDEENAVDLVRRFDVVVDGTDNFPSRYLIDDACSIAGRPTVWGSVYRFEGQLSVFDHTIRYRDLYNSPPPPAWAPACGEAGVLGTVCGVVGTAMANEAVKLITGIGSTLVGRLLVFDALNSRWEELPIAADPDRAPVTRVEPVSTACALGPRGVQIKEVSPAQVRNGLADGSVILLDVREIEELEAGRIPGSVHAPLSQLREGQWPERRESATYVTQCKSGVRSLAAAELLIEVGWSDVCSMRGGIDAWAREVGMGRAGEDHP